MRRINLLVIFFLLIVSKSFSQTDNNNIFNQPYVEVNGAADTMIVPDEIYINITISENDSKQSVEQQETKMINALQSLGINIEKDLSTSDIISDFKNRFLRSKDVIKTKSYQLKVHDAMTAGKVFAALEDNGIANSSIDHVDYSKMDELKNVCRTKAIANAKTIAEALAKPLGQEVGKAIQIIDANNSTPTYTPQVRLYAMAKADVANQTPQIDFQKIKITASENVKFLLK
ncbi:MAG: SIMPL domain-containing protein [Arachidicoccus sp.]|nr:SIMPL domain-containing protein [Arachidicoccus sp.]